MTFEILLVLCLLAAAILIFAFEWIPLEITTLIMLAVLVLSGVLTPDEAFSGFANQIIIILASLFVLAGALMKTGVMDYLGGLIYRRAGGNILRTTGFVMLISAFASAFMNNTTTTAVFLPAVVGLARRAKISPSRLLIPLAFGSILGGTCTLIGTSTNVAASGYILKTGLEPYSLLEFLPVGLAVVFIGTVYMVLVGLRFLPDRGGPDGDPYQIKDYLSEFLVPAESPLVGQAIQDTILADLDLTVLEIVRGDMRIIPAPFRQLEAEDVLIVKASRESLLEVKKSAGIEIRPDAKLGAEDLVSGSIGIAEAIIMPQSWLAGETLKEMNFRRRFGFTVLAIYRRGHALATKLGSLRLRVGDVLLLQGRSDQIRSLQWNHDIRVLEEMEWTAPRLRRGVITLSVFVVSIVLAALDWIALPIAFLLAAVIVILLKNVTMEEVYRFVEWPMLILIAGMTAFGLAMEKTGAADYLANSMVSWVHPFGIYPVMAGFALLTVLLTQPMSNAAAALVVLPMAVSAAQSLQVDPRSFAVLVTLSASVSLVTPFEPACMLVYGPGKYRFRDYVISGLPLTILGLLVLLLLVPVFWPLQ